MLNVDLFFNWAIQADATIVGATSGRIYNTARPDKDETEDRIPYLIVTYDGGSAGDGDKDDILTPLEHATVSILCVASSRGGLKNLTDSLYAAVKKGLETVDYDEHDWAFRIEGCTPSAGAVQMDADKPCYFQALTYTCDTTEK